jgi:hypothetical protein
LPYVKFDTTVMPKRGSTLHHYQRQAFLEPDGYRTEARADISAGGQSRRVRLFVPCYFAAVITEVFSELLAAFGDRSTKLANPSFRPAQVYPFFVSFTLCCGVRQCSWGQSIARLGSSCPMQVSAG